MMVNVITPQAEGYSSFRVEVEDYTHVSYMYFKYFGASKD